MFCLVILWNLKHNCHFTRIIVLTKNVTQGNRLLKSNLYVANDSNADHVDFFSYWKSTILKVCVFFSVKQSWLPYATFLSIEFQFWISFFLRVSYVWMAYEFCSLMATFFYGIMLLGTMLKWVSKLLMAMLLKCIYCAINESVYHNFMAILQAMLMNKNRVISENFYFRGDGTVMILQTFSLHCIRLHFSLYANVIVK